MTDAENLSIFIANKAIHFDTFSIDGVQKSIAIHDSTISGQK